MGEEEQQVPEPMMAYEDVLIPSPLLTIAEGVSILTTIETEIFQKVSCGEKDKKDWLNRLHERLHVIQETFPNSLRGRVELLQQMTSDMLLQCKKFEQMKSEEIQRNKEESQLKLDKLKREIAVNKLEKLCFK
jgi:hypothetical protein